MSTAKPQSDALESDSLASLEDRILRTVELVAELRAERDAALAELAEARAELAELASLRKTAAEAPVLREEITELRSERMQVRLRIEKLLAQMDQVSRQ